MTTEVQLEQSTAEEVLYPLDFSPQLLDGVVLNGNGATVTHTPPSGSTLTVTPSLVSGLVYVPIPQNLALGVHKFSCVATTNNSSHSPEILLVITVTR